MPKHPAPRISLAVAALFFAIAAPAQLAHEGPTKTIALAASLPPYDVISIKKNDGAEESWKMSINDDDDRFVATNVRLIDLITLAYDIKADLVSGLSGPLDSFHMDVEAKVLPQGDGPPPKLNDRQLQAMVITLLADRFHLKAHLEPKTLSVYNLVVVHGGPKFKLSQEENHGSSWNTNGSDTETTLTAKGVSMEDLASALSDPAHRKVIDKTGLKGTTDLTITWTPDDRPLDSVISIFTAVQEQLGLKLEPSKGPVEVLVIDHVELPSTN